MMAAVWVLGLPSYATPWGSAALESWVNRQVG